MALMSTQTRSRVKRTALQVLAGGALGGLAAAVLADDIKRALLASALTAISTTLAAWFQNVLEDIERLKDRRL